MAARGRHCEVFDRDDLPVTACNRSEVFGLPKKCLCVGRTGKEIADQAALGKEPVCPSRDKASAWNAAHDPARRFPMSRCPEKEIAWQQRHRSPGHSLDDERSRSCSEPERANMSFKTWGSDISQRAGGRDPAQHRSPFDPGGEQSSHDASDRYFSFCRLALHLPLLSTTRRRPRRSGSSYTKSLGKAL